MCPIISRYITNGILIFQIHNLRHCAVSALTNIDAFFLIYKHLLLCMLHYYAAILHALMVTFTYYLLLSTYYIYRFVPYLSCHIYTLDFV